MADATRQPKLGDVVKKELWPEVNYCRDTGTVSVTSDVVVGTCLELSGSTYIEVVSGTESDTAAILIDKDVYNYSSGDTPTLGLLVKGPAVVAENALSMADSATEADVITALEALDILVEDSVS